MALINKVKTRVINPQKFEKGRLVRLVKSGEVTGYKGAMRSFDENTLTLFVWADGSGRESLQVLTAAQLYADDYSVFLQSDDLVKIWSEADRDMTVEVERDVFDITETVRGQFVRWTKDGFNYINGLVTGISKSQLTIITVAGTIVTLRVQDVKAPDFDIEFADALGTGEPTLWWIFD